MTKLAIATRLHLGRALEPPSKDCILKTISNLDQMAAAATTTTETLDPLEVTVVIAVDATPKLEGYDYVQAVRDTVVEYFSGEKGLSSSSSVYKRIEILPVTPWFKFVPALNALVIFAKSQLDADLIMFVSAEVNVSPPTIRTLCCHVTNDKNVIVAGAALNGHQYAGEGQKVPLTGRYEKLCIFVSECLSKVCIFTSACLSSLSPPWSLHHCTNCN
jgi:hypothetical protein